MLVMKKELIEKDETKRYLDLTINNLEDVVNDLAVYTDFLTRIEIEDLARIEREKEECFLIMF